MADRGRVPAHPRYRGSCSIALRFSQLTVREVRMGVAVIPLHTLMAGSEVYLEVGSEVQIDVPLPLAVRGSPHGTAYIALHLSLRCGHIVRALARHA